MKKVGFMSLGCPKNLMDTEVMLKMLLKDGFEITPEEIDADVVIINTCGFIESAKQESIDAILDVAWLKKHRNLKGIVVTGCLAERYREEIFKEMPEVDAMIGVGSLDKICEAVNAAYAGKKYSHFGDKNTSPLGGERLVTTPEYTAYLKIAEGCDNRCAYCAIPDIRGRFRSRTIEDVVAEARDLEALGIKELCLVAQDTSRYGLDIYGKYALAELVKAVTEATKIPWIRLMYCYPDKITDELCEEFKNNDRLVKYIDMPIQHISDTVLERMNRHGGSEIIKDAIARLRAACPEIVIRTTVMVGFPGETKEDVDELCRFIREAKFERLGAFTFSPEEGTPAYDMDGEVDEQDKQDRYDLVMQEQMEVSLEYNESKVGKVVTVLVEGFDPCSDAFYGRTYADAPEIDTKVYFTADTRPLEGTFIKVRVKEVMDYDLIGKMV